MLQLLQVFPAVFFFFFFTDNKIKRMASFEELPEGCIAAILSRTTPFDAVRLSLVSKTFRSAADSDEVWNQFLPSDSRFIDTVISQFPSLANAPTKKALYLALSDCRFITEDGRKSFQLDRKSGKNCYMIASRSLTFDGGDFVPQWKQISTPMHDSRFPEVAELDDVYGIDICGTINTIALSPNTQYVAYLVFKMVGVFGINRNPVEFTVRVESNHNTVMNPSYHNAIIVCLYRNLEGRGHNYNRVVGLQLVGALSRVRSDGWFEIEMGEFFNSGLEYEEFKMNVNVEIKDGDLNTCLLVEGIEVRPK